MHNQYTKCQVNRFFDSEQRSQVLKEALMFLLAWKNEQKMFLKYFRQTEAHKDPMHRRKKEHIPAAFWTPIFNLANTNLLLHS